MASVTPVIEIGIPIYSARYGEQTFEYHLHRYPSRKKRALKIHVHPNGVVQVDAPESSDLAEIKAAVQRRARWILKHLTEIDERARQVTARQWVSGENMLYLGRRYALKVIEVFDARDQRCRLVRGQLRVEVFQRDVLRIQALVDAWYRKKAGEVFSRRLVAATDSLPWVKQSPEWRLLKMRTQWGSCTPQGELILNPALVRAPTRCIDYVLLHELCHLQEHNHSPRFYQLLDRYMPDWRAVKEYLDGQSELIMR